MNTFEFKLCCNKLGLNVYKMYVSNYIFFLEMCNIHIFKYIKIYKIFLTQEKIYITVQKIILKSKQNKNILAIHILHIILT